LFKQIDSNHDGLISLDELVLTLEKQKEGKSLGEVQQIFEQIDGR
jgi:Ca2+-binding EF-hand superfamily protein